MPRGVFILDPFKQLGNSSESPWCCKVAVVAIVSAGHCSGARRTLVGWRRLG